uniref:Uncharacterized protein n=1 Tax=Bos mutus grunniens TaxID=30521 RepID=A0A8B9Y2X6_BOSMU
MDRVSGRQGAPTICIQRPHSLCQSEVGHRGRHSRTSPILSRPVFLPCSTSMRLPASSVKLGQKLEQYLSAIQRSESVKCANPSHTEFLEAPVDVASKRHLFEKELVGQNREGPAASCKENLELSGLVKSRLRWISRIQESAQQGPQNQETQRALAAGRKPQWRKKPEAPLGTKISVLEERAVSGKREVPDKASDSEKRPMSEKATVFKKTPVPEIQPAPGRAMAPLRPQDWEHSASAECPSSPGGQRGTGPEKEPESSAGPLSQDGGLPPVTLQVRSAPRLPVLPASLEASPSSWHPWRPPCLLSSHLLGQACPVAWLASFPHPCWVRRALWLGWHLSRTPVGSGVPCGLLASFPHPCWVRRALWLAGIFPAPLLGQACPVACWHLSRTPVGSGVPCGLAGI